MKVSIVIPVFNQEKYIKYAIDSCLLQTYRDIKIIVVNDGSTDSTREILRNYGDTITVIDQVNRGTSAAWNNALRVIDTEYVLGLDSDDELVDTTVHELIRVANDNPACAVVYSDYVFINSLGQSVRNVENPETASCQDAISKLLCLHDNLGESDNFLPFGHARLYKTAALRDVDGYDTSYLYAEDFDLILRLAESGHIFMRCPGIQYRYRWHSTNKGVISRAAQKSEVRKCVELYQKRNAIKAYDKQRR